MTAAEITLTETSRTKFNNLELVTGTATTVTTNDWIDVQSLTPPLDAPKYAHANLAATGVDAEAFVASGTSRVTISGTGTGAVQVLIVAPSYESTGGD